MEVNALYLDPSQFEFVARLEANWQAIQQELEHLDDELFLPYPERYLLDSKTGWDVFGLYFVGVKIDLNCELCPEAAKLLKSIPGMITAGFSRLNPHAHIVPHSGKPIGVLRCHMGLIVPERCALRVGSDTRRWEEGKCMVFDDTSEHEAWNLSDIARTVLLIDFKAPVGFQFPSKPQNRDLSTKSGS